MFERLFNHMMNKVISGLLFIHWVMTHPVWSSRIALFLLMATILALLSVVQ